MSKNTSKSDAVNAASNHPTIPNETPARTAAEQAKLDTLEKAITDDNQSSFRLAAALAEIRDAKLYQPEYKTFEEYSKKRWQYSRSYCSRLCDVHEVLTDLKESTEVVAAFKNVGQARVFVDLEKDERIQLAEKVTEAVLSELIDLGFIQLVLVGNLENQVALFIGTSPFVVLGLVMAIPVAIPIRVAVSVAVRPRQITDLLNVAVDAVLEHVVEPGTFLFRLRYVCEFGFEGDAKLVR